MGAEDALAQETDLLGDALRSDVVRIREQIDALELEHVERDVAQSSRTARVHVPRPRDDAAIQYPIVPR